MNFFKIERKDGNHFRSFLYESRAEAQKALDKYAKEYKKILSASYKKDFEDPDCLIVKQFFLVLKKADDTDIYDFHKNDNNIYKY